MDFYNRSLSKEICIFSIDDFNISNEQDASQLKNVYRCLFLNNDMLYFSFRREENLTDENTLRLLKIKISETFNKDGAYVTLREMDETRFDSVGRISIKESTFDFLFDIWNYFYSCTFFVPKNGFAFSDYVDFQKRIKFQDKGGEKLLKAGHADFECIKGLGGDSLIVSYQKDYQLPDLKKAALYAPRY